MPKYNLTLNQRQAEIVAAALDLYARIGIGQFEEILTIYDAGMGFQTPPNKAIAAKRSLEDAKFEMTGFHPNASHGIPSPAVNDTFKVAFDICKVVKHRLAWDHNPNGGMGVNYDTPDALSKESLPEIKQT